MKRLVSSILLLVFLNYIAGYYIIFWVLKKQANLEMSNRLDSENYMEDETVTIKLPLTLPYAKDWNSFERIDGAFEHNGEYFKLVKQKLERDTLYIVCIRDDNEKKISGIISDFVKITNDMSASSKTIKHLGNFTKDYEAGTADSLPGKTFAHELPTSDPFNYDRVINPYLTPPAPPPKS